MTPRRGKLTITQVSALTFGVVAVAVALLFYGLLASARRSVVARSERVREAAAARVSTEITRDLGEAEDVVAAVEQAVAAEAIDARTPASTEGPLFALLLEHPNVADISFTNPEWQLSVFRGSADPKSGIVTRVVRRREGAFVADVRSRAPGAKVSDGVVTTEPATDPTEHLTYKTTVSPEHRGDALWSSLQWSERDLALPEAERRVVVTLQQAVSDPKGKLAGVVRVGLLASTVDAIAKVRVEDGDADDPHRVFICGPDGRLLTRLAPGDRLGVRDDEVQVIGTPPPEVARALASEKLRGVSPKNPTASEAFVVGGQRYLLTLRSIGSSVDWVAAILVPEEHYTRDLRALRDRFVGIDAVGAVLALLAGAVVLASVRGGFRRLVETTSRMRDFDLAPDPREGAFADVDEVVQGLERAKTAMRALGKYVPVDLVRTLYAANREPELGGTLSRITLMFTDIRGFTDLSERLTPNELARALGYYLEAMTTAIRGTQGTIDKFIGDAVMTIWNAPTPVEKHALCACRAALACDEATARLYESDAWRGLPPLLTRYGIHTGEVLVGHFGAPTRLSYTALGDGVNLAARLESLCKQYGIIRLVSEAVEQEARGEFAFRRLDRVAVKGKSLGVLVFELLGPASVKPGPEIAAYEAALEHYFARRFEEAIRSLTPFAESDPPSKVLLERCSAFLAEPPPADWDGTWVARSK